MKIKVFCRNDMRKLEEEVNGFLETLTSDNPREPERVIDIKYGDSDEAFSAMVIYK